MGQFLAINFLLLICYFWADLDPWKLEFTIKLRLFKLLLDVSFEFMQLFLNLRVEELPSLLYKTLSREIQGIFFR